MKRILLEITDELRAALDAHTATTGGKLNPSIEAILWRSKAIRDAAKANGIERQPRPRMGRPKTAKSI